MVRDFSKTSKGSIGLFEFKGRLKVNFPRQYFPDIPQIKKGLQLADTVDNRAKANQVIRHLQLELEQGKLRKEDGTFNDERFLQILADNGIIALTTAKNSNGSSDDQVAHRRQYSLMEIWDMYCNYRRPSLKESNYERNFIGQFTSHIKTAIAATNSEDAIKIRNWLVENRHTDNVKRTLSNLSSAYKLAKKQQMVAHNPFEDMACEIKKLGDKGKKQGELDDSDNDLLNQSKAYTWEEVGIILAAMNTTKFNHWYKLFYFKFLTGCRSGEAIGFMWQDIYFDGNPNDPDKKPFILIKRTYDEKTKKFYPTKNDTVRSFPMPKDGELWQLLKSMLQGEPNEVVFKSKQGKVISNSNLCRFWGGDSTHKGFIRDLEKQGKINKYLPPYNTRHSFISHQIYDLGVKPEFVNAWCEHSEAISQRHYRDIGDRAMNYNPELPANHQEQNAMAEELAMLKAELAALKSQQSKPDI